jgi:mono/diheme cytochrome c family protein
MRSRTVRTFTLALAALFAAAALGFGWLANRPRGSGGQATAQTAPPAADPAADPAAGARLFETYCASCHTAEALRRVALARADRVRARAELERFLENHGGAAAEQNRAIVAYVTQEQ